jgi:hypothetical protein
VIGAMLAEVAGKDVSDANLTATGKVKKGILPGRARRQEGSQESSRLAAEVAGIPGRPIRREYGPPSLIDQDGQGNPLALLPAAENHAAGIAGACSADGDQHAGIGSGQHALAAGDRRWSSC